MEKSVNDVIDRLRLKCALWLLVSSPDHTPASGRERLVTVDPWFLLSQHCFE